MERRSGGCGRIFLLDLERPPFLHLFRDRQGRRSMLGDILCALSLWLHLAVFPTITAPPRSVTFHVTALRDTDYRHDRFVIAFRK
jgi:hypothetical protein